MTGAQKEIVDAIADFWKEYGVAPTVRELCSMTGRSSSSTVHTLLTRLRSAGVVEWMPGKQRTLRVRA